MSYPYTRVIASERFLPRAISSRFSVNHGFGEVKSTAHDSSHFLLCKDILRVATFCKVALDSQNMGIQETGRTVTFFSVLLLPTNGVYVFHELGKVQIPNSLQDLTKLVMNAPLLLLILDVFKRLCVSSTLSTSSFNQVISLS